MEATYLEWIIFNLTILFFLGIDLFFHRKAHVISLKEAFAWSAFWMTLAIVFNFYIYYRSGLDDALDFFTGYLIEKSLSVDNLFVFILIFKYFHTPSACLHDVLFWGVLGAIVFRALFIWLGLALVSQFSWMFYIFGIFLLFTGIKLWFEKDKEVNPEKNFILKLFNNFFPVVKEYHGNKFFVKIESKHFATPLFAVLISIETTDIIFAIDSIPAILAITSNAYLVYTSNIFAILGLRSLYFVLSHIMTLFHYLHYGLSLILGFIGIKMLLMNFFHIPTFISLIIVFLILSISVSLSLTFPQNNDKKGLEKK